MPVPFTGRREYDLAGVNADGGLAARLNPAFTLDNEEGLTNGVAMPSRSRSRAEAYKRGAEGGRSVSFGDVIDPDVTGEPVGRTFDGEFLEMWFHCSSNLSFTVRGVGAL
jgi:hypothetical protein